MALSWLVGLLLLLSFATVSNAYIIINAPMTDTNAAGWVLGGNPASATLTGNGTVDPVGSGWLRITNNTGNQTGFAYNTTSFDLSAGVLIQFDYAAWGGSGADGISVFLFDSNVSTFNIGAFGGSLGYAQKMANNPICNGGTSVSPAVAGVSGGYVGVGLDEYGNFAACTEGRYEGWNSNSSSLDANTVTIRGPVVGFGGGAIGQTLNASSYPWLYTSGVTPSALWTNSSTRPSQTGTGYRKVIIQISPAPNPVVNAWIQFGFNTTPVQIVSNQALPAISASQTLMVGFGASTGGSTNYHEVRNLLITSLGESTSIDLGVTKVPVATGTTNQITSVGAGAPFQYLVTATNFGPNPITATGVGVTDTFPANITPGSWTCAASGGATCGAASGTGNINSTANLPQNGTVTYTVNATVPSVPTGNSVTNTASLTIPGAVTDYYSGDNSATSTLGVYAPLTVTKSFNPATATGTGTHPTMTVTLSNPNSFAVSGVAFTDTYPTGLTNNAAANTPTGCGTGYTLTGASGGSTLGISGATITANSTCTLTVPVKGSTVGQAYVNTIPVGAVTTTTYNIPNIVAASATFDIMSALVAPTQSFSPNTIGVGGTSQLTINLANSNALPITGAAFTDTLPANLVTSGTATTSCTGGALTTNSGSIVLSGASIPTGGCTVTVNVTSSTGNVSYSNPGIALTTTNDGNATGTAGTLTVLKPLAVTKSFAASTILPGGTTTQTITLDNVNTIASITGGAFTDTFPTGLLTSGTPTSTGCGAGATVTASNNGTTNGIVTLSGATITTGTNCVITVNVTSSTTGSYTNTIPIGAVTSTNAGSNSAAGSASLVVMAPPSISKSFSPNPVAVGSASVLTILITNPNPVAITGAAFTDTYPTGSGYAMTNTATPAGAIGNVAPTTGCSGTVTAANNGTKVQLSGGNIPANGSCQVTVNVQINSASGTYNNAILVGGLATTNSGSNTVAASANLNGPLPPTVTKSFSPSAIVAGSSSTLTISVANPNSFNLTGAAFTDSYPSGMVNLSSPAPTNSCGGTLTASAGTGSLSLSGGTIPAAGCSITVPVTSSSTGGTLTNTMSALTTTQTSASNAASGSLTVILPPAVSLAFSPASVVVNVPSTLTITLSNPATNGSAITGAAFTDNYPSGLVNSSTTSAFDASSSPGCSGTITGNSGSGSLTLSGGSIPVGGSCVIKINVSSATAGSYSDSTGAVSTGNSGTGTAASSTLTATLQAAPTVSKSFAPASIPVNGSSTISIALSNPAANALPMTGVSFTDSYPTNGGSGVLVNTSSAAFTAASISAGCTGTVAGGSGASSLTLTNGTIPVNTTCTISVNVTSSSAGVYNNSTGTVTSSNASSSSGASSVLGVLSAPTVTTTFNPSSVPITNLTTLTIQVSNPNATDISGASFTDTYALVSGVGSLVNATSPNAQITGTNCSGTLTANAGASSLSLSNGTIPAGTTCTITVSVNSTGNANNAVGTYQSSLTVASGNAPTSASSSAQLSTTVLASPTITKSFNPTTVPADGVAHPVTLTITLTNPTSNPSAITGVTGSGTSGLLDSFPSGMTTTGSASLYNSCGGTATLASGSIALNGGTIPAGAAPSNSCTLSTTVQVSTTNPSTTWTNTTNALTTSNATPSSATASAILRAATLTAPTVGITFAQSPTGVNVSTTMTITLTNPSGNTGAITGVNFTDSYPTNGGSGTMVNTSSTSAFDASSSSGCSGTVSGTSGSGTLTLTGGSIPAGGSCVIKINVDSATSGTYLNGLTVSTTNAGSVATSGTLVVLDSPVVTVQFNPTMTMVNSGAALTFSIYNPNSSAITGASFTDSYPSGSGLYNVGSLSGTCSSTSSVCTCTGGSVTAANNGTSLSLSNGTIPGGGTCTVTVSVTSATGGTYNNSSGNVTVSTTDAGSASVAPASLIVTIAPTLTVTKTASPASGKPGDVITYTVVGSNPSSGYAKNVALTDYLSPYTFWGVNSYGAGVSFRFTDGTPPSGLTLGTPSYSRDGGSTWSYTPASGANGAPAGYDGYVTNWQVPLIGTMNPGGANFTLTYTIKIR